MEFKSENESVAITLAAPAEARVGAHVPIGIVVRNAQRRTIGLATAGPDVAFDILVTRGGSVVWQRLYGQTVPLGLQIRMLEPGETLGFRDVWHANVDAGSYRVAGRILTDADPLVAPAVTVEIVER